MRLSTRFIRLPFLVFLCLAVGYVVGCSRPMASVKGRITYKGNILKGGTICFHSTEGAGDFGGYIAEDGTYSVPSVPAGTYKVVVETDTAKTRNTGNNMMKGSGKMNPPAKKEESQKSKPLPPDAQEKIPPGYKPSNPADMIAAKQRYVEIPSSYGKADTTPETYTVVPGDQTHDIELK
jgi:hypothetical protein